MNFNLVEFDFACGTASQLKKSQKPEIVFSGRSNVGKSSLINKIFNRKSLARVSATPGKTITVNFFKLENLHFVDLPGYGYAKRSASEQKRWSQLVQGYFDMERDIALVIQLVDMRHPASKEDIGMLEFLVESNLPFMVAYTKSDKLNKTQYKKRCDELEEQLSFLPDSVEKLPFSSQNGDGLARMHEIINEISDRHKEEISQEITEE